MFLHVDIFSPMELSWLFCWKSIDYKWKSWFLDSQFCSIDLYVYLYNLDFEVTLHLNIWVICKITLENVFHIAAFYIPILNVQKFQFLHSLSNTYFSFFKSLW